MLLMGAILRHIDKKMNNLCGYFFTGFDFSLWVSGTDGSDNKQYSFLSAFIPKHDIKRQKNEQFL
jgi:hypothetical protein